jgi:hypothetical protein
MPVNLKSTNWSSAPVWRDGILATLLAISLLAESSLTAAPTVIANQAPPPPLTTEWQQDQPNEMDVFVPFGEATPNPLPEIFRYGPLQLRPHADYRFLYGSGIEASPSNQQATIIQELSPGILADLGPHWVLNYTPTIRLYSNHQFQNTVDHSIALTGATRYEDWTLGFSHSSMLTTAPLAETGGQTEQETHATSLTASTAFNQRVSADFDMSQVINLVSGFQDSYDWSTLDWLNYQFWPRLNFGLGAGGGYVKIDESSSAAGQNGQNGDQTYEQMQARINWRATDKISFQVSGGLEDRQFMSAGSSDSLDPVYGAAIAYQPFKVTQISLSANRTVSSSDYYVLAQQSETTIFSVNLNQRLLKEFNLGLSASYSTTDFNSTFGPLASNRTDKNTAFNVRLSHPFFKRGTWSVFCQYNDNSSTQAGLGYQSNQVGFEVSYNY